MLANCIPEPGKICKNQATFNVWFEKCDGLYGFMCDEHVAKAIVDGVNGYRVYQITALNKDSQYPIPAPSKACKRITPTKTVEASAVPQVA